MCAPVAMASYMNTWCDLSHLDPDLNIPLQSNFQYYSTQDFHNDNLIRNCTTSANSFSVLHSNIRSLAANTNNFKEMLCELDHNFSVILAYRAIPSYHSPAYRILVVRTAFYIDENLQYNKRSDISKSTINYE
jgi:hypothetical protein